MVSLQYLFLLVEGELIFTATTNISAHSDISFSTDIERNDVKLPEGNFIVDLTRFEAAWDINPWVSVSGNIQYDTQSEIVGLFARARWIMKPGNDLFLVYTNNRRNLGGSLFDRNFRTLSQGGSVKVNYTYRL